MRDAFSNAGPRGREQALQMARHVGVGQVNVLVAAPGLAVSSSQRVLRSCLEAAQAFDGDFVGDIGSLDGSRVPVPRFGALAVDRSATGAIEAMSLFAGESVGAVRDIQFARDIVRELSTEAERLLRR